MQLLVAGGISLSLEEALVSQLRALSTTVQALVRSTSSSSTRSVVDNWLDHAALPVRTSVVAEASAAATKAPSGSPTRGSASSSWQPSLRSRVPPVRLATTAKLKARPASEPRQDRPSTREVRPREPSEVIPRGLSPKPGDSVTTEWSDSELEPVLETGQKLTRGLKRHLAAEIREDKRFPRPPTDKPPASLQYRGRAHRSESEGRFSPARETAPSKSRERPKKESRRDRSDSRPRRSRRSPSRPNIPAPGAGKHFGKNKGKKKRERQQKVEPPPRKPYTRNAPGYEEASSRERERRSPRE